MGLEAFMRRVGAERDRRFRDPAFQRELAAEKRKTVDAFNLMGSQALETICQKAPKAALMPAWRSLQAVIGAKKNKKEKYSFGDVILDTFGAYGTLAWSATKLAGTALHAAGRTTKLGLRYLFAK